jgi:hypothetical protein
MLGGAHGERDIDALPGMVKWYNPRQLSETALRHVITGIFGQYADQRIMQATIDGFAPKVLQDVVIKRYDYSKATDFRRGDAFWVDYVADLGDGFDSTYAIASLISADELTVEGAGTLPGGKLLILGGDQVYPFPTRWDYENRFVTPYEMALPGDPRTEPEKRHMFALPGNHDWYDGLNSFDHVFCKSRYMLDGAVSLDNRIGGWLCPQHRSYWAIRLPHNWWIWGADIQLSQYLDAGQILYFREVAREMARSKTEPPKLILCIAEPSWNYDRRREHHGEDNLDVVINLALDHGARICAILAGDLHHYSRYHAPDLGLNLITSGGGGAYFSPTHPLRRDRKLEFAGKDYDLTLACKPKPIGPPEEACWPSRRESRWLNLFTLGFPFRNYMFAICLGVVYWLLTWPYSVTMVTCPKNGDTAVAVEKCIFGAEQAVTVAVRASGRAMDQTVEMAREAVVGTVKLGVADIFVLTLFAGIQNPALALTSLLILMVLIAYADARNSPIRKAALGLTHWLAHMAAAVILYISLTLLAQWMLNASVELYEYFTGVQTKISKTFLELAPHFIIPPLMWLVGGFFAGLVWGTYLMIASLFNRHCDDAFSSMRMPIFRHFLRMKVEPDRLTIYPIGLKTVPLRAGWRNAKPDPDGIVRGPLVVPKRPLKPELIDGPIVVDATKVRARDPMTRSIKTVKAGV